MKFKEGTKFVLGRGKLNREFAADNNLTIGKIYTVHSLDYAKDAEFYNDVGNVRYINLYAEGGYCKPTKIVD